MPPSSDETAPAAPAPDLPPSLHKRLQEGELPFKDFMELALYAPGEGYYARAENRVSRAGDYVTAGVISPVFAFALARLVDEFVARAGDGVCSVVDIGCGDGGLIAGIVGETSPDRAENVRFHGIDRSLSRVPDELRTSGIRFGTDLGPIDWSRPVLVFSNELFDSFPVARVVQRDEGLHELTVVFRDGRLDWGERPAPREYAEYFSRRGIRLDIGQFADISLEWERCYADIAGRIREGLIITFDYGYPELKLFNARIRRWGTVGAFWRQTVHRDVLARPGRQDLTAHINFTDLDRAGEERGLRTLLFTRQAAFLLSLGVVGHPLLRPLEEEDFRSLEGAVDRLELREAARRLVLPDGIGEEMRVLVQARGLEGLTWSFQNGIGAQ